MWFVYLVFLSLIFIFCCLKDAVLVSSSGVWGDSCPSCCLPRRRDHYHQIQQHSRGNDFMLQHNLKKIKLNWWQQDQHILNVSRVLPRKQNLGRWQMRTEFSQTFMVVMTGGMTLKSKALCTYWFDAKSRLKTSNKKCCLHFCDALGWKGRWNEATGIKPRRFFWRGSTGFWMRSRFLVCVGEGEQVSLLAWSGVLWTSPAMVGQWEVVYIYYGYSFVSITIRVKLQHS